MKKIIKLGMVALTALTMAGCSSESEDVKTITVGISPDYAPYESENKKGDIVGFDPDMMKCFEEYLSDEEGVTYKLEMNTCIKKFLASDDYAKLCKKYDLSPLETK